MTKTVQMYNLHLINGDVIPVPEDFDLTGKKTLLYWFSHEDANEIYKVGNQFLGFCYVPRKSVVYISTGDVEEQVCFSDEMMKRMQNHARK